MFLFCKSIIFSGDCSKSPPPLDSSVKTRFKAFWDIFFENVHATLDSQVTFFLDVCPQAPQGFTTPGWTLAGLCELRAPQGFATAGRPAELCDPSALPSERFQILMFPEEETAEAANAQVRAGTGL